MCSGDLPYVVVGKATDKDWLAKRLMGIGASEIATLLGEGYSSQSPFKLWAEKTGLQRADKLDGVESVQWGKILEPVVIKVYAERTGRPVRPSGQLLRSVEHPWALCTLDAWTGSEAAAEPDRPFEVKTWTAYRAEDWIDGPPEPHVIQVHHQMLVTGAQRATIACLIGGQKLAWADVERDEATIRRIVHHGREFWRRVEERDPPPLDGSNATKETLAALFPDDNGTTIALPVELREAVEELALVRSGIRESERRKTQLENEIKAEMGKAAIGVLPGGLSVSWKKQRRDEYTVPAVEYRVLRIHTPKK